MRHEKSLHLSLEKWICAPLGEVITSTVNGQKQCVYCDEVNPTREHLDTHNHYGCEEKGRAARTFYRKDHLRQHLRLVHGCKMTESMELWKSEATFIKSRCGFCAQTFTTWIERCDHLSKHFRAGARMKDWKGCRGLDANVAAQVTNAMPPYLIGTESNSIVPFSASNESSMSPNLTCGTETSHKNAWQELGMLNRDFAAEGVVHPETREEFDLQNMAHQNFATDYDAEIYMQMLGPGSRPGKISTCWEILTVRLGLFVKEALQEGIPLSDDMIQRQARMILYESDDTWNQTAADNAEWLELFKKAHGLPSVALDETVDFTEDLGINLGDMSFDTFFQDNNAWDVQTSGLNFDGLALV